MSATNVQALVELAGRIEAAVPSDWRALRTLAKDIYRQLNTLPELVAGGYGWQEDDSGWWCETGEDQRCPRKRIDPPNWLTSIDAAMSLVPDDVRWTLSNMRSPRTVACINAFDQATGATPALALTSAALKARAAIEGERL